MAFDFKKDRKDLYAPKTTPALVDVPVMGFFAVAGCGNPNEESGSYAEALEVLYALSYAVKMAKMGDWQPQGYFDYVVAPLEGLWWTEEGAFDGMDVTDKDRFRWVSLIRQPDFVTPEVLDWAREQTMAKKPELAHALERARLVCFAEGPCAQVMHRGTYDAEPATIQKLAAFIADAGRRADIAGTPAPGPGTDAPQAPLAPDAVLDALDADGAIPRLRFHHEIYLGDPRRTRPENLRTVIRHPVRES